MKLNKNDSQEKTRNTFFEKYNCNQNEINMVYAFLRKNNLTLKNIKHIIANLKKGGVDLTNIDFAKRTNDIKNLKHDSVSQKSFILRYGETLGIQKWQERHNQISNQMKQNNPMQGTFWLEKIDDEKERQKKWKQSQIKWKKSINEAKQNGKYEGHNSLQHYQTLYGKREGTKRFNSRVNKMFNTMTNNGNHKQRVSKMANDFFEKLYSILDVSVIKEFNFADHETRIKIGNKRYFVDLYYKDAFGTKIIEFFGDYWHANPNKYNADDIIVRYGKNKTQAHIIWEEDARRINAISKKYNTLIIWEDELKDIDQLLNKCKNFLQG